MICVQDLCFEYSGGIKALNGVSFDIEKNETVCLIGQNGAGKSTLLSLLLGLLEPVSGSINIAGENLDKHTVREVRRRIGMVFQNPDDQLFMATPKEDMAFGPENFGMDEKEIDAIVLSVAEELGITHLLDRMNRKLSGGEKRLCSVATVLTMSPDIIFFDEPLAFLDPVSRRSVADIIKNIKATKLIATHDLDMAMYVADRVIVLKDGQKVYDGGRDVLKDREKLLSYGLDLPLGLSY